MDICCLRCENLSEVVRCFGVVVIVELQCCWEFSFRGGIVGMVDRNYKESRAFVIMTFSEPVF